MTDNASRKLTTRRQQAIARREQILSTALGLFGRQGYAGTTTRQIAQSAGITEGLIFRYFPTKASILHAIAKERDVVAKAFASIFENSNELPASAVLERIAVTWMTLTRGEIDFMSMLISEGQINPAVQDILHGSIEGAVNGLAAFLAARVQAGEIRANVPLHSAAANFFAALLFFFITHRRLADAQWNEQARSFIPELLDTWLHGTQAVLNDHCTISDQGGTHDFG